MQNFKGDALELKMIASGQGAMTAVGLTLDDFYEDAYQSQPLGDVIVEGNFSPLAQAIPQEIFRQTFDELFRSFQSAGTFEGYISVFKKVFGEDVIIEFTVPEPGHLQIEITSDNFEVSNFVARRIVADAYVYDNVLTQDDEQIIFQTIKGFQSQYELEQMLFEMVPGGVYTEITLNVA